MLVVHSESGAINSTNCILEIRPEFGIIGYLRWDMFNTSGQDYMMTMSLKYLDNYQHQLF